MFEIGRICIKVAGRDAGKKCVIIDILENNFVLIDGETRRRKCNIIHLDPLNEKVELKKGASHDDVAKALKDYLEIRNTSPKKAGEKPKKQRKKKSKDNVPEKKAKKIVKKKEDKKIKSGTEKNKKQQEPKEIPKENSQATDSEKKK